MPDKEGSDDEKKSTKSVVNKKQKQMMGEEGYDVARDMGRVKPSKDKKDATTMPPSKEMEKTRKVNKGPSAFERVKKKYKGQIMKMEELDLTKVAEAFGGYIVEETQEEKKKSQGPKITGDVIKTTEKSKAVTNKMAKNIAKQDIEKTGDKFVGGSKSQPRKKKGIKFGEAPGAGPVKTYNVKDVKPISKPVVKKTVTKQTSASAAAADALKDMQKDTRVMGKTMPDIKQDAEEVKLVGRTLRGRRARRYKLSPEKQAERLAKVKAKIDAKNPTFIGKSGKPLPIPQPEPGMKGFKGFKKRTQRSVVKTGKQVAKVAAPVATPVAKFAKASPLATTIAGIEVAKITPGLKRFFTVKPPLPPAPKGGKVGRRTAG